MTPEEAGRNDLALRRAMLTLWQTRMLRPVRLKVIDEVKNGISYFEETFFTELPRLYIQAEDQLQPRFPGKKLGSCRPSSASAAGSAATATATPSSPPRSCAKPCACNRRQRSIIPRRNPRTRRELPLSDCWSRSRRRCWRWPNTRPTIRRTAPTSPTAAR
jgi:hypothetical protein